MKALVDIDERLLKLATERTGQTEKSTLINMGLRELIKASESKSQVSSSGNAAKPRRTLGGWEGVWIAEDFDETPDEIIRLFTEDEA